MQKTWPNLIQVWTHGEMGFLLLNKMLEEFNLILGLNHSSEVTLETPT